MGAKELLYEHEDIWETQGFELARAEPIGFEVQHLNHSVTLS